MPENIPMLPGARNILTLILLLAGPPALAQAGRYELFPEPDVRQNATNRTASAYVVDKKSNHFWICTARYDFRDLSANNGDCVPLPTDIGRPSLSETYSARPVTGTVPIGAIPWSDSSNLPPARSNSAQSATRAPASSSLCPDRISTAGADAKCHAKGGFHVDW